MIKYISKVIQLISNITSETFYCCWVFFLISIVNKEKPALYFSGKLIDFQRITTSKEHFKPKHVLRTL